MPIRIAPVPACCWGFLRTPADFASRPNWPFPATFHSLLAIPRSGLAPWNWPEVRKGHKSAPYRSETYARTNQAVGLGYWQVTIGSHYSVGPFVTDRPNGATHDRP